MLDRSSTLKKKIIKENSVIETNKYTVNGDDGDESPDPQPRIPSKMGIPQHANAILAHFR